MRHSRSFRVDVSCYGFVMRAFVDKSVAVFPCANICCFASGGISVPDLNFETRIEIRVAQILRNGLGNGRGEHGADGEEGGSGCDFYKVGLHHSDVLSKLRFFKKTILVR